MIAAAANAIPQASCVLENNVFYGSRNLLVSWNVESKDVKILASVDGVITAICEHANGSLLIGTESGSLYRFEDNKATLLNQLPRPVTCVCGDPNSFVWAAGSMDGKVYVYGIEGSEPAYTVGFKGYALCAAIYGPLLVLGGTCNQIFVHHLHTKEVTSLSGHENWVRSLSFKKIDSNTSILASASQERYIRLWKFSAFQPTSDDLFSTSQKIGEWSVAFEALLMGHDDWVVSVSWDPYGSGNLLSASADSSLIIWESETDGELWTPAHRLGDLSTWGASTATGTSGGFWSGLWLPNAVTTITRTGSWRVWQRDHWEPAPGPTGHFRDVTDVAWFNKQFLLTTSIDQTTRLWFTGDSKAIDQPNIALKEIGRPQIHGYDMVAVSPVNDHIFVSAGDEKVMRVFELPKQVSDQMAELAHVGAGEYDSTNLPQVAGVPALGLSNKPETDEAVDSLPPYPREDHLQRLTLWPEIDKLYGHGYEISSLAVSPRFNTVISCCKSNSEKHANLRFYSTETWHEVSPPVSGHSSTVNRLRVSPNGQYVLSVSRDRKFMVVNVETHEVILDMPKAHTRIIWDGCWCNDEEVITVSRDKTVKKWSIAGELKATAKLDAPITAVDFENDLVVAGDENGNLTFLDTNLEIRNSLRLAGRINRVALNSPLLAVASELMVSVIPVPK